MSRVGWRIAGHQGIRLRHLDPAQEVPAQDSLPGFALSGNDNHTSASTRLFADEEGGQGRPGRVLGVTM